MSDQSPDFRAYVDLSLYDRTPQDIIDSAIALAQTRLPDWVPREGNTEVVLLEAQGYEVSELVFALNRVHSAVATSILRLYGLSPDPGDSATATAIFTVADTLGHTIPIGTNLRLTIDFTAIDFTTDEAVVIPTGSTVSAAVPITATTSGVAAHDAVAGATLELLDNLAYVDGVVLGVAPSGGSEPETSTEFLNRGAQALRRLVSTLVLPEHFTAAALDFTEVFRATTIDNFNGPLGSGVPGDHPGHVTVAVLGEGGATLSAGVKADIDAALEAAAMANLAVHVVDPTITVVPVTVTVKKFADYTDQQVIDAVTDDLAAYLNPDTWEWSGTVYVNELIALISGSEGVDRVVSLTAPASDTALTGVAPLTDLGAVSITVT